MKKVRIGLIGTGNICNGTHIPGYQKCGDCEITAICDSNPENLIRTGERLGIPEECRFSDYRKLLASGLADALDITTSNDCHVEIAIAALEAGYPVSVEKPIGINFEQSLKLLEKSKHTGLPVFVCFSWRYQGFVRYMKHLITEGTLGQLYHIYVECIKNSGLWKGRPLEWRFQEEKAGSGVLGDLGSHMFDAIRFFGEEVVGVYCDGGIIIRQRPLPGSDEMGEVTTDDWDNVVCRLKSGIGAAVKLSRTMTTQNDCITFEVVGSAGGMRFEYRGGKQRLLLCAGDDIRENRYREISVPEEFACEAQSISFVNLLLGRPDCYAATIEDGIYSQAIVDAAKMSASLARQVKISELFREDDIS